jgi:hypothetical protein
MRQGKEIGALQVDEYGPIPREEAYRLINGVSRGFLKDFNPTQTPLSKLPVIDVVKATDHFDEIIYSKEFQTWLDNRKWESLLPPFSACWLQLKVGVVGLVRATKDSIQVATIVPVLSAAEVKADKDPVAFSYPLNVNGILHINRIQDNEYLGATKNENGVWVDEDGSPIVGAFRTAVSEGYADYFLDLEDPRKFMRDLGIPSSHFPIYEGFFKSVANDPDKVGGVAEEGWESIRGYIVRSLAVTNYLLSRRAIEKSEDKVRLIPETVRSFEDDRQYQKKIIKNMKSFTFDHITILSTDMPKRVTEKNVDTMYAREPYQIHTPAWLVAGHTRAPARAHERHMKDGRVIQVREGSHSVKIDAHVNQHKGIDTPKPKVEDFREIIQVRGGNK